MQLADELFDVTRRALNTCSEQQRTIYQLVHGITTDGTTHQQTLEAVARALNLSRSAARWHLAMAEVVVYRSIAQHLIAKHETITTTPGGTHTTNDAVTYGMSIRETSKQQYNRVTLGPGSDAVLRASRLSSAESRTAQYQQIHERYTQQHDE